MGYRTVKINDEVNAVIAMIEGAKKRGIYDQKPDYYDGRLVKEIKEQTETALANAEAHTAELKKYAEDIKKDLKEMEARLGSKSFGEPDRRYVEDRSMAIQLILREVDELNNEYRDAMMQYKLTWDTAAKDAMSNPALISPFQSQRKKTNDDRTILDLSNRMKEYGDRAREFQKQADQRARKGDVEIEEFRKDVEGFASRMEKDAADIEKLHDRVEVSWKAVEKIKPKAATQDDLDATKSRSANAASAAKEARGRLKTMTIEYEGLRKRSDAAGPGWKKLGQDAVAAAKKSLAAAEKLVDQTNEMEKDIAKKLKEMKDAKDKR